MRPNKCQLTEPPSNPSVEEELEMLRREMELLRKEVERRNQQLMGVLTILCLPMTTNRKLEVGFSVIKELKDDILKLIIERYVKEGVRSDLNFDEIMNPMVTTLGIEKLWKLLDKEKIKENFGDWALARWIEIGKAHRCET